MSNVLAWHFLPDDGCLRFGKRAERKVQERKLVRMLEARNA